jgi:hypothetical protein
MLEQSANARLRDRTQNLESRHPITCHRFRLGLKRVFWALDHKELDPIATGDRLDFVRVKVETFIDS